MLKPLLVKIKFFEAAEGRDTFCQFYDACTYQATQNGHLTKQSAFLCHLDVNNVASFYT